MQQWTRISTQWFVKMRELAGKALAEVLNGNIKIHPEERFLATYKYWLENVKDCVSAVNMVGATYTGMV